MRSFALWAFLTAGAFAAVGASAHATLSAAPERVFVAVDSSYAMREDWPGVEATLQGLAPRRYTSFQLVTDKGRVHPWSDRLDLGGVAPYAPRGLDRVRVLAADAGADRNILITNAPDSELRDFVGWRIVRPGGS